MIRLAALTAVLALAALPAFGQELFRDDFDGQTLDADRWAVANWNLGRTRLGQGASVADGVATLKFDTFDPQNAGERTLGTEIFTKQAFARPEGGVLEIEARVRLGQMPSGIVTSIFTYATSRTGEASTTDEIDFEFLSTSNASAQGGDKVLCTTWNDWRGGASQHDDEVVKSSQEVAVERLDLEQFNTFRIRWHADKVEWFVNDELIRTATTAVPDAATPVRFNFWAALETWTEAYSADLKPAATAEENETFTYHLDYLVVRAVEPS